VRIVVAHSQLNAFGGGERAVLELLRHLSRRHEVALWAGNYRPDRTYPELAAFTRRDLAPAEWIVRIPRADVVITHTFGAHLLALRHPATICYVHTLRSRYLQGEARPDLAARRALDRLVLRRAAVLATNSAYSAERIARRYGRLASVIPCGVSQVFAMIETPASAGSYALYVGRVAPEKGLDRLITWSAELSLDLHIGGTGDPRYVAHLRTLAGPRVRWLGPVHGVALTQAYAGARCVVMLSEGEEFGLAALEGMAAARPVVALRSGGLPELVDDGISGIIVDDRDSYCSAVRRLAEDDVLVARLGSAGRERARAYTWEAMALELERLGQQALGRQRARS
jgi:glycosyltransferase involved in cell wall biosynthesis